ncbi:hypothetical protein ACWOBX_00770 [Facklamia languida]|nr:hypothetical protein [Facklamia languida]
MSKMSDMSMTIEELRNAAAAINDAANWLAQHPISTTVLYDINLSTPHE